MSANLISRLDVDGLRELFQTAGYRVETVSDPVANVTYLRSATNGLAFDIRPGNRLPDDQSLADVALVAVIQVQGELPLAVVNRWNASRRFGRLQASGPFLALSLDLLFAGGVSRDHLRAQIEIWDHLVQQLIVFLREEIAALPQVRPGESVAGAAAAGAGDVAAATVQ
ncbi:YbjN domain-containing protein [Rhodopseudomonas palustris]|uniref:YbjN domain-containing protein n=1 Tax=Rhodopseudomonas palustris TaxID=1076 RepID=UPI002ACD5D7E|nr:YbjN domain-containing protein [Rhodopseudomonas palustris]WQH00496.1 YbjN domain-containing protein [Rhodopseudomonas palustris]